MPRISSRISTSFSRNACGSRAGSLMMARSWPALSRASARNILEPPGVDVHDLPQHFVEARVGRIDDRGRIGRRAAAGRRGALRHDVGRRDRGGEVLGGIGTTRASPPARSRAGSRCRASERTAGESSVTSSGPSSKSPVGVECAAGIEVSASVVTGTRDGATAAMGDSDARASGMPGRNSVAAATGIAEAASGVAASGTDVPVTDQAYRRPPRALRRPAARRGSRVGAGRAPVSPASRFAKVSSSSTGTSMVCGTTRGAEMRSIETMM